MDRILNIKAETLGIILLGIINVAIIGPGSWIIKGWKDRYDSDRTLLTLRVDNLETNVMDMTTVLYSDYLQIDDYKFDQLSLERRFNSLDERLSDLSTSLLTRHD